MSRPNSANQGPKKIYLGNKSKEYNKNLVFPSPLPSIKKKEQYNDFIDENFNEELSILESSWDELGITHEYRLAFINLVKIVSESERADILIQEKINLKKFRDALLHLKKEIANRENNLSALIQLNRKLDICINDENNVDSKDSILKEVINIIKNLRLNAVNIVSKIIKVNQISAYYSNSGKFDLSKIRPEYSYSPKYLYKMKDDLFFLKNSTLSKFIEMNNSEIDGFLTNCAPAQNRFNKNQKITIPISDDLMGLIIESRYSLLQETVLSNIDKDEISLNMNIRRDFSNNGNFRRGSNNNRYKNNEEEKLRINQNRPYIINNKNYSSQKNNFFKSQNMSKYIYDLKNLNGGNRYNFLFYNNIPQVNYNRAKSGKKRILNSNNFNPRNNNYITGKRINIEHEVIPSLTNKEYLKRLNQYKSPDKSQNSKSNLNHEEEEKINEIDNLKL